MTITAKNRHYMTAKDASRILGVHTSTLRNWAVAGKIEVMITPGRRYRYDVDGFLAKAEQATAAKLARDAKKAADRERVRQEKQAKDREQKIEARRKIALAQKAAPASAPAE